MNKYMRMAINEARKGIRAGHGGPFGAVIVKDGEVVGKGHKGKGTPEYWAARVSPGRIMFEADGVPFEVAKEALRLGAQKLPVATKFVVRRDYSEEK